jgi:hypothetical protein
MKNYFQTLNHYATTIDKQHNPQEAIFRRKLLEQLRANKNEIVLDAEQVMVLAQDKELFDVLEL